MQEVELTFRRLAAIWWLLAWRGAGGAMAIGFAVGLVLGIALYLTSGTMLNPRISFVVGAVIGLVWGFVALRMALRKRYKGFRIALIATTPES